ncbi:TPA: hypothetical protein UL242_002350 [Clostridioides difficile]|uniref:hypothetical protein n=1 Tax=Clostridioides difficile TaxID=1496 RepID=UPI000BB18581|nr:hypothetical protein [Clostridioides difficile]EGT3641058.1 hypothetical protein [Clostridioides difficile]MBH7166029.1 hypothetical protein [Clostridioides difficile]MBH7845743.1 hypothetical protein [Clostridioides difficile]MBY1346611.1 hypothetical protein [Clostridioides difficile]MBY1661649.1 hypothetical protein [Clostridioides difficile]
MINVTNHALRRYVERIKKCEKNCIEQDLNFNKEQHQKDLTKMFEQSKLIYTGRFNDRYTETNFRLVDNIILITDLRDTKIITLYKIEYGFNREIDLTIIRELIKKLDRHEKEYISIMQETSSEKEKLEADRENLVSEIKTLKEALDAMNESLIALNKHIDTFSYKEKQAKSEMDITAKKIVYSNVYRKEMLECIN